MPHTVRVANIGQPCMSFDQFGPDPVANGTTGPFRRRVPANPSPSDRDTSGLQRREGRECACTSLAFDVDRPVQRGPRVSGW